MTDYRTMRGYIRQPNRYDVDIVDWAAAKNVVKVTATVTESGDIEAKTRDEEGVCLNVVTCRRSDVFTYATITLKPGFVTTNDARGFISDGSFTLNIGSIT